MRYSAANPGGTLVLMEEIAVSLREALYLLVGGGIALALGMVGGLMYRARSRPV